MSPCQSYMIFQEAMDVLLILCLVAVSFAQVPQPCESPKQWEAREIKQDYQRRYSEFRKLSYDEEHVRIREFEDIIEGSNRDFYNKLYLYRENKNYTLNLRTRECTVEPLTKPFRVRGVHPDAKFDGFFNIGPVGTENSVTVQTWSANETTDFYTGLVTYPDCYPVQNIYVGEKFGFSHSDYFDVNVGIIDPNVFLPSEECVKAEQNMKKKI